MTVIETDALPTLPFESMASNVKLSLKFSVPSWVYENVPLADSAKVPLLGPDTAAVFTVWVSPASLSVKPCNRLLPVSRLLWVAVCPLTTVKLFPCGTGSLSFKPLITRETLWTADSLPPTSATCTSKLYESLTSASGSFTSVTCPLDESIEKEASSAPPAKL